MSVWTHVAGIIRVDSMRAFYDDIEEDKAEFRILNEAIGRECDYESDSAVWADLDKHQNLYMPCGSEGTLKKSIWVNPDPSYMSAYTISVFGDLRDFDNVEEVAEWFINACKKIESLKCDDAAMPKLWIRNAVIIAECEDGKSKIVAYHADEEDD